MNKYFYKLLCMHAFLQATVEIDNQSPYPFKVTSITYEQYNGLQKIPRIEFASQIIDSQKREVLSVVNNEPITHITAHHLNKDFSFEPEPNAVNIILIDGESKVRLLNPKSSTESVIELPQKPADNNMIRLF